MAQRNKPSGKLPTIWHFKSHQVSLLIVICQTANAAAYLCHHEGRVPLAGLPDVDLSELGRRIRFRCAKCGGTKVELRPDWASAPSEHKVLARAWITPP